MDSNVTFFSNVFGDNEANSTESDTDGKPHTFMTYFILFGLPFGVLLVVVPAMAVIIIILKNRKLREKSNNIFYVNLLITDVVATVIRWVFTSTIIICYLFDIPIVKCNVAVVPVLVSLFATLLMFLPVVIDRFLHIAFPFSYKRMFTTTRIAVIISCLWLLSVVVGLIGLVDQDITLVPESGVCVYEGGAFPLLSVAIIGMLVIVCMYISTCHFTYFNQDYRPRFQGYYSTAQRQCQYYSQVLHLLAIATSTHHSHCTLLIEDNMKLCIVSVLWRKYS